MSMYPQLARSFRYCERLAQREAGNFYHAFRVLPALPRRSMCALYTFLRITDDLADGSQSVDEKRRSLQTWQSDLEKALAGTYRHPSHPALHYTMQQHQIPPEYLNAVLEGVGMDLEPQEYHTFEDLYHYCYRVASVVGLSCIHIWGFNDDLAKLHAEKAGIAFQLTNILRDLGEDAARDRVYLPREEMVRFGYGRDQLYHQERNASFRELMRFQVERARSFYATGQELACMLPPHGRAVFLIMQRTYSAVLDAIEASGFDVFRRRIGISKWRKMMFVLQFLPIRWGLV